MGGSDSGDGSADVSAVKCESYWTRRFWGFLKCQRELKGVSKREKDLGKKKWDFSGGGAEIVRKKEKENENENTIKTT